MDFYKVALSDFAGEQLDSATCLISPEVSEAFDIKSGDTDYCLLSFVQPRFVKSNNILSKLLQIKVNPRVEKNCVSVLSSGGHDFCYIAPVLTSKCQVLENVEFQGKVTEDRRTAVLDFIQKLVCGGTGLLPVNLGQELANENGDLVVYSVQPCAQGLVDPAVTNISVKFCDVPSTNKEGKSEEVLQHTLSYTLGVIRPCYLTQRLPLGSLFRCWKQGQFNKEIKVIPSKIISQLLTDNGVWTVNSTVVVSDFEFPSRIGQLQTISGYKINVQVLKCELVDKKTVLVAPSFGVGMDYELPNQSWCLKPIPEMDPVAAEGLELSSVFTPVLSHISPSDLDNILEKYFEVERRYDPKTKFIQVDALTNLSVKSQHLKWKLPCGLENASLYFRVEKVDLAEDVCDNQLFSVCSSKSRLSLRTRILHIPLPHNPSDIWIPNSRLWPKIIPVPTLPPHLDRLSQQLADLVQTFDKINPVEFSDELTTNTPAETSSLYGPILLRNFSEDSGGTEFWLRDTSRRLGFANLVKQDCRSLVGETSGSTEAKVRAALSGIEANTLLYLEDFARLTRNAEDTAVDLRVCDMLKAELMSHKHLQKRVVLVAEVLDHPGQNSVREVLALFQHIIEVNEMSEVEKSEALDWLIMTDSAPVYFSDKRLPSELSRKCRSYSYQDLKTLVRRTCQSAVKITPFHRCLTVKDFEEGLGFMQSLLEDAIGAPQIPTVKWEDVGGLEEAKREILDVVKMPFDHPELFSSQGGGYKRSGILLYGPPGVGKTLLAKAVATECSLSFLSVKGPELLNMYIGQSEQNVREVFSRARKASPCIIFFDELDALAPNRGKAGDSGGVMDRIVSQLLAEMDGVGGVGGGGDGDFVFVIGATNRPDLVDQALLRPGRFDRKVYLGAPTSTQEKIQILSALTRNFTLEGDNVVERVVHLSEVYAKGDNVLTGADMYALAADAMSVAIRRKITSAEERELDMSDPEMSDPSEQSDEDALVVTFEDFETALAKLKPSVSPEDMAYYQSIQ